MNLARHINVLWRFRLVAVGGVILGLVLAFLAAYSVPGMERRGSESWSAESDVMVTQPGFPEGRVTLPDQSAAPGAAGQAPTRADDDRQKFADPGRFSSLALLYSIIAYSDQVRQRLPDKPARGQIQAVALDATGNGTTFLPIIRITTQGTSAAAAVRLNDQAQTAFKELLEAEQRTAKIADNQRVRLNVVNAPAAKLVTGRSLTPSILAFMLCLLAAVAVAHVLEGIRPRRPVAEDSDEVPVIDLDAELAAVSRR